MQAENLEYTSILVRGVGMKLMTYTRSLELCSRMNYETENLDFIDKMEPGQVMYDLGACEGRFSLYAALKGIRVVSFEPEEKNFSVLSQNIQVNALQQGSIHAIHAGVGAANGKAVINIGQPWAGGHQKIVDHGEIRNDLNFDFVEKQEINLVSLDELLDEGKLPVPDYLKIDIDGSELPFLKGAEKALRHGNLKGIIFELNESDPNFKMIIADLSGYGFKENGRFNVPNEPDLYNIIFYRN